mgnify:CR=1 FL=1
MWYKFTAYNSETLYGWTTDPAVAQAAEDRLNRGKEVNLYAMEELSDSDDESDGRDCPLRDRDTFIFTGDTTVADYEDEND